MTVITYRRGVTVTTETLRADVEAAHKLNMPFTFTAETVEALLDKIDELERKPAQDACVYGRDEE